MEDDYEYLFSELRRYRPSKAYYDDIVGCGYVDPMSLEPGDFCLLFKRADAIKGLPIISAIRVQKARKELGTFGFVYRDSFRTQVLFAAACPKEGFVRVLY
jgi:hypothetical protein